MLTGRQIREARILLKWDQSTLARRTALLITIIKRAEATDGEPHITMAQEVALKNALVVAGVEFLPENGGGAGVRLRKGEQKDIEA